MLFELGGLVGTVARLQALVPTEAVTFRLPSSNQIPAKALFEQFDLTNYVNLDNHHASFATAFTDELRDCIACRYTMRERRTNAYDEDQIIGLEEWLRSPPSHCTIALIELKGYFQSYKYFEAIESKLSTVLAAPAQATKAEADAILRAVRRASQPASSPA